MPGFNWLDKFLTGHKVVATAAEWGVRRNSQSHAVFMLRHPNDIWLFQ